jgi:hypothetical protein
VVGKPVQEDYYVGKALQALTVPMLKQLVKGWAGQSEAQQWISQTLAPLHNRLHASL